MFHHLKEKLHASTPPAPGSTSATDLDAQRNSFSPRTAGIELSQRTFNCFYNPTYRQFCSPYNEPGTIDKQHGYVVWPVSIAVWAVAEAARRSNSREDKRELDLAFAAMERHWNPSFQGYCAWVMFDGNKDLYFDDNAHCGNALVTAFEATGDRKYVERARQIVTGLISRGWDRSGNPGGVAWHIDKTNSRNACSTLSVSMLACRLALHNVERSFCMDLAASCITFSEARLLADDDGLCLDAIQCQRDGSWKHDARKFTYNTGFAIQSFLLWHQLTGASEYLEKATKLALVAIEPSSALFNKSFSDPGQRIWSDTVFFAHHLVEALVLVAKSQPRTEAATNIVAYLTRLAAYIRTYIVDPQDQLYFRNLRMNAIDQSHTQRFNATFGANVKLDAEPGERENGPAPREGRPMIKTLLGNASVARIFLCISDLVHTVPLPAALPVE